MDPINRIPFSPRRDCCGGIEAYPKDVAHADTTPTEHIRTINQTADAHGRRPGESTAEFIARLATSGATHHDGGDMPTEASLRGRDLDREEWREIWTREHRARLALLN